MLNPRIGQPASISELKNVKCHFSYQVNSMWRNLEMSHLYNEQLTNYPVHVTDSINTDTCNVPGYFVPFTFTNPNYNKFNPPVI
jgi:hypothetical protein